MAKFVLDVSNNREPKENDILVYNEFSKQWEYKSQGEYLKALNNKILKLNKRIDELNGRINEMQEDIKYMAKAMKEGIK